MCSVVVRSSKWQHKWWTVCIAAHSVGIHGTVNALAVVQTTHNFYPAQCMGSVWQYDGCGLRPVSRYGPSSTSLCNQKEMKFDTGEWIFPLWFAMVFVVITIGPTTFIIKTTTTQQALNQECKTNYSFLEVAVAGDNLSRLCQIKQQTITIKWLTF